MDDTLHRPRPRPPRCGVNLLCHDPPLPAPSARLHEEGGPGKVDPRLREGGGGELQCWGGLGAVQPRVLWRRVPGRLPEQSGGELETADQHHPPPATGPPHLLLPPQQRGETQHSYTLALTLTLTLTLTLIHSRSVSLCRC